MRVLCRLTGHKAVPSNIWNAGYYFTRCGGCGCEMIGRGGVWKQVPRGFRVVWRPRDDHHHSDWTPVPVRHDAARLSDMIEGFH